MDDVDKMRLKLIKDELIITLESGSIKDAQAQYSFVNSKLKELLGLKDKSIGDIILRYLMDQDLLNKQIEDKQKDLQKLIDEYGDNVKEIYEAIKKI